MSDCFPRCFITLPNATTTTTIVDHELTTDLLQLYTVICRVNRVRYVAIDGCFLRTFVIIYD